MFQKKLYLDLSWNFIELVYILSYIYVSEFMVGCPFCHTLAYNFSIFYFWFVF